MHLLELFSGTGSVGRPFRENNWQVTSVDLDNRYNPEINTDIMTWDYTAIKTPDVIWSSPPCTQYSQARTVSRVTDFTTADVLVAKTLEIIKYFEIQNPNLKWFMENPNTGRLKTRPIVQDLPFCVLDYCQYGAPYRKRTRIWNNVGFIPRKICNFDCAAPKHLGRHFFCAQRGTTVHKDGKRSKGFRLDQLHALPEELCQDIFASASNLSGITVLRDP